MGMKGILADNNIEGQVAILLQICQSPEWREVWAGLGFSLRTFEELGLARNSSDALVWQTCQEQQLILITANRNDDGPDSLEATIREQSTARSLPVLTPANARRVPHDRAYAKETAEKVMEYLLDIENYFGAGRLFVP
jgi:hypothetical protein